jgi:hypothetical protein
MLYRSKRILPVIEAPRPTLLRNSSNVPDEDEPGWALNKMNCVV